MWKCLLLHLSTEREGTEASPESEWVSKEDAACRGRCQWQSQLAKADGDLEDIAGQGLQVTKGSASWPPETEGDGVAMLLVGLIQRGARGRVLPTLLAIRHPHYL